MDFTQFFQRYEQILAEADAAFATIAEQYPAEVKCRQGCCDCCYALFDLPLIEALYLNHTFNAKFKGGKRAAVLERADAADREGYRLKKAMFKAAEGGRPTAEIMEEVAKARIRCPLLGPDESCELYEHRPVTCRVYGVPTAIYGEGHTCGLSGFTPGTAYPTVHMEKIQDKLLQLSQDLVDSLKTKHIRLAEVLVPVSMALLTEYDDKYLGLMDEPQEEEDSGASWTIGTDGAVVREANPCAGCAESGSCSGSPGDCGKNED